MEMDSVLKKLRKLQNLYEGAKKINSEGEAMAAAAAIQKLLAQYNLTMDEVNKSEEKSKDEILEEKVSGYTYKSIGGDWEFRLLYVICKWNFCKCFQVGGTYKRLIIFGKKENMEMVKWLRDMLSERFVEFSKKRFKEYKETMEYAMKPISMDKYQRSYLMGCAAGLDAKLKEESDRDKKEDIDFGTKVTALVVRNDAAITEYINNKYRVGRGRAKKENYDSARAYGFKDGKNTDIHRPISGGKAQASNVKLLK